MQELFLDYICNPFTFFDTEFSGKNRKP